MPAIKSSVDSVSRLQLVPRMSVIARSPIRGNNLRWSSPREIPRLVPRRLHWGSNGDLSTLTLHWVAGEAPGEAPGETTSEAPGEALSEALSGTPPHIGDELTLKAVNSSQIWFTGHVAQSGLLIQSGPDRQCRELTLYGAELRLRGKSVHGQWCKRPQADALEISGELDSAAATGAFVFQSDLPVIFNAGGRPNASTSAIDWCLCDEADADDSASKVFEPSDRLVRDSDGVELIKAEFWTAATALRSLIERVDGYSTISPKSDWQRIDKLLGNIVLGELALEGMNLLEAISHILKPAGFGFCIAPWPDGREYTDGATRHVLHVFPRGGDEVSALAPILGGGNADSDQAQVRRLELLGDAHNTINSVSVIGDLKRLDISLEFGGDQQSHALQPAWDTSQHDLGDYAFGDYVVEMGSLPNDCTIDADEFLSRYSRGGQQNTEYFHVFRTFAWNEDASMRPLVASEPDLSPLLGDQYIRRPRPVGASLIRAAAVSSATLPAHVLLGVAGNDDSWILLPHTRILKDRAGFTINIPHLDSYYPYADACAELRNLYYKGPGKYSLATLLLNALDPSHAPGEPAARLRLVGTIQSDMALSACSPYSPNSIWPLQCDSVVYEPERFKFSQLSEENAASGEDGDFVLRDDSVAAGLYAENLKKNLSKPLAHGSLVLYGLQRGYRPGVTMSTTRGRAISLDGSQGSGNESCVCVRAVNWSFAEGAARTELLLESPALELCK